MEHYQSLSSNQTNMKNSIKPVDRPFRGLLTKNMTNSTPKRFLATHDIINMNPKQNIFTWLLKMKKSWAIKIASILAILTLPAFQSGPSTTVHLEADFNASPARVYDAFMDEKQFSTATGKGAAFKNEEGAEFRRFNGAVTGRNIELIPNSRIVLAWHSKSWPASIYTIVRLEFVATATGTRVILDQTGIPPEFTQIQKENWPVRVFGPLANYLK
jgi:activator of HSP90 ATPase